MPQNTPNDVFISYSHLDEGFVTPIVEHLRLEMSVFYDKLIAGGEFWAQRLDEELRGSRVIVLFITRNYLDAKSVWPSLETQVALIGDKYVIPVLLQTITPDDITSPLLKAVQAVECGGEDVWQQEGREVIAGRIIETVRERVPGILSEETLDMNFVILAMTRGEAERLLNGDEAPTGGDARDYDELIQRLGDRNHRPDQIVESYGKTRNDWRPPLCPADGGTHVPIRRVIKDVIGRVNELGIEGRALVPQYYSERFTSSETRERIRAYDELKEKGCVLIVDALSLFYPKLRDYLTASTLLDTKSKTAPIVMPLPYCRPVEPIEELIEKAMDSMMNVPFYRFDDRLDLLCEFGVAHPRALKRWLFSVLPMTVQAVKGPDPEARRALRDQMSKAS